MAKSKKIKYSEIAEPNLFGPLKKELEEVDKRLKMMGDALKGFLSEIANMAKQNPFDSLKNIEKFEKGITDTKETVKELTKVEADRVKVQEQLKNLTDEQVKAKLRFAKANKDQRDSIKDLIILEDKESGTLEKLAATNRKLTRERKSLNLETEKGRARLKEINATIDANTKTIKDNSDSLTKQRLNVGNYSSSIKDAVQQSGFFSRELAVLGRIQGTLNALLRKNKEEVIANTVVKKANARATSTMSAAQKGFAIATRLSSKALKGFKTALIGTGIGAIVVALGALVAMLTKTQGGMDLIERSSKAVSTTFNVLIDRFSALGSIIKGVFTGDLSLSQAFEQAKQALSGIGDEISREVALVDDITKRLQALRIEASQFTVTQARLRAEIEKLRLVGEDETKSLQDRITALKQAFSLEEQIANERIRIAKEQVLADVLGSSRAKDRIAAEELLTEIIDGRTKLTIEDLGVANSTAEDLENTNNKIAELIGFQSEQYKRQRSELSKINSLIRQQKTEVEGITTLRNEQTAKSKDIANSIIGDPNDTQKAIDALAEVIRKNEEALAKKEQEFRDEELKKQQEQDEKKKQLREETFAILGDLSSKYYEKQASEIEKNIQLEQKRLDTLNQLAAQGNEDAKNNIAIATQRQAQLELERERQLQRQKRSELALTAIQTYSEKVASKQPNPLASTIADISVLRAFINTLPGFYEGTEDTGTRGILKDKDGAITGFTHEKERVLSAKHNRLIGDMSNAELASLAYRENTASGGSIQSEAILNELRDLKRITKDKPVYLGADYDPITESVIAKVKAGQRLERIHKKTGGIWG